MGTGSWQERQQRPSLARVADGPRSTLARLIQQLVRIGENASENLSRILGRMAKQGREDFGMHIPAVGSREYNSQLKDTFLQALMSEPKELNSFHAALVPGSLRLLDREHMGDHAFCDVGGKIFRVTYTQRLPVGSESIRAGNITYLLCPLGDESLVVAALSGVVEPDKAVFAVREQMASAGLRCGYVNRPLALPRRLESPRTDSDAVALARAGGWLRGSPEIDKINLANFAEAMRAQLGKGMPLHEAHVRIVNNMIREAENNRFPPDPGTLLSQLEKSELQELYHHFYCVFGEGGPFFLELKEPESLPGLLLPGGGVTR